MLRTLLRLLPLLSLSIMIIGNAKAITNPPTTSQPAAAPKAPVIVPVAGNANGGFDTGDGGVATDASLAAPIGVAVDKSGNVFILDSGGIRKVTTATGIINTVPWPQDDPLITPTSVAVDTSENVYVLEGYFNCDIRELVSASGAIVRLAGGSFDCGERGNGGPAVDALLSGTGGSLIVDRVGNLYFSETDYNSVWKITAATGILNLMAGSGDELGDGGFAIKASLPNPGPVAVDANGNLYIADLENNRIRKVNITTRIISTVVGNGTAGFAGDGGLATEAEISGDVEGLAVDKSGNIYISDSGNARIREVSAATGIITTIAGTGSTDVSGDQGPAIDAGLGHPGSLALDASGSIFFADPANNRVREITLSPYQFERPTLAPDITPYASEPFTSPQLVSMTDSDAGAVIHYTTDGTVPTLNSTVYTEPFTVSTDETISAIAVAPGYPQSVVESISYTFVTAPAQVPPPQFSLPGGTYSKPVQVSITDPVGGIVILYSTNGGFPSGIYGPDPITITSPTTLKAYAFFGGSTTSSEITSAFYNIEYPNKTPEIVTVAGISGSMGYSGDGGIATSATLNGPNGVALDKAGDIFISDENNGAIRKVSAATGIITSIPGINNNGATGDFGPSSVAVDPSGNIYVADSSPACDIRKVNALTGAITIVAGQANRCTDSGDGGLAVNATIGGFFGASLATDLQGNVYFSDSETVRKITVATGVISRVAGTIGVYGFSGDGSQATSAKLYGPGALALDVNGNLYIADVGNYRIRKVNITTRTISTVAGNGTDGFSGDGGAATAAEISSYVEGLAVDRSGNIYISDAESVRIREVSATTGIITTITGNGLNEDTGDLGPAIEAGLGQPGALTVDPSGSLFFADRENNVVREISASPDRFANRTLPPNFSPNGGEFVAAQQVSITPTQSGSVIYYTTDGSTPTTKSTVYSGPITASATEIISAIAVAPGFTASTVVQASFAVVSGQVATPQFSPAGGSYPAPVQVSITDTTGPALIYYTTDGSTPNSNSTFYDGPFTISSPTVLKAIGIFDGQKDSSIATANYALQPLAGPTIYPASGTYTSPQTVVITDATPGVTIYYTIGANPQYVASSFVYTGPFLLAQTDTVTAYAAVAGADSNTSSASYVFNSPSASVTFPSDSFRFDNLYPHGFVQFFGPNMQLVDGGLNEASSVWYNTLLNVKAFTTDFSFQTNPANGNGFTFVLQNQGIDAIGKNGSGLGYEGIGKSVAIKFDFFNSDGEGTDSTGLYLNGAAPTVPSIDLTPSGIDLHSNTLKLAHLVYDGTTLTVTITDKAANASATHSYAVDIPAIVGGNSAYAGFTAGTGSAGSNIVIESWDFTPTISMAAQPSPAPVILPVSGNYQSAQTVTIQDAGKGAVIHYTLDGSQPTATSPVYSVPLEAAATSTVKAIAIVPGYAPSEIVTVTY